MNKTDKVIVVGGGMSGLTATAYLARAGKSVKLFEKSHKFGGLVNSYERNGFIFDGGIRSIEDSGILFPMLRDLNIKMEWVKSNVSIGLEDDILKLKDKSSLIDYESFLKRHFPNSRDDIENIMNTIKKVMSYMDVLYGIENPLFMNLKENPYYAFKVILPWFSKYIFTVNKILKMNEPVDDYIVRLTSDIQLKDNIIQHFFKKTPAFFALSYFSLYLDYHYPKGGTGKLPEKIEEMARKAGANLIVNNGIESLNPEKKYVIDSNGEKHFYDKLLWAADLKTLYRSIPVREIKRKKLTQIINNKNEELEDLLGGDSVLSLNISVDLDRSYFSNICSEHFFYTPDATGMSTVDTGGIESVLKSKHITNPQRAKQIIKDYLCEFFKMNTYEISIPVLRDETLAPKGKTGLIISTLFDYQLAKLIKDMGWYDEFMTFTENCMIQALTNSVYPELKENIIDQFSSSPLSIEKWTSNTQGAITGWAFTNDHMPVINKITGMFSAVDTPLPHIYQAGQWSYSPSGLPIAILSGKRAADKIIKSLK
ncbi:MAG: NAD(P)/FAD-dependent oxidoreductase [Candidatus Marinimicrobia bacterium]|nr:NAD(P)/FAD-dependent oxidoreductase [Candidatus Neomarinimicrobiota bacterium]